MPGLAVIATQLTTPVVRTNILLVGGADLWNGGKLQSLEWEHVGSNGPASLRAFHYDATEAFSIAGHANVTHLVSGVPQFQGVLMGRTAAPLGTPTGRTVQLVATDYSIELDRNLVEGIAYPAGLNDRAIVQGLCGNFLRGTVSSNAVEGATTLIASTNVSMPAMTFEMQTLRSALEQVAITANGDGTGARELWVDASRRLRYRKTSATAAPYTITDGAEGGGAIQPDADPPLTLVDDDSAIVNAVFVQGANAAGSGWEVNGASVGLYGWRAEQISAPDSDTLAKRTLIGQSYLSTRGAPVRRGTFQKTGTTGWEADQNVTITNATLGLSAVAFLIKAVTTRVLPSATVLQHSIEFGARKPTALAPRRQPVVGGR